MVVIILFDIMVVGMVVDFEVPSGFLVSAVGLECEGFWGCWFVFNVLMFDVVMVESFVGVYLVYVVLILGC